MVFFKRLLVLFFVLFLAACSSESFESVDSGPTTVGVFGLAWTAPSQREDGTAIALSEIASYHIYYGTESGDYQDVIFIEDSSADQAQVADIPPGTYYVVVTTVDTDGRESAYSSEVVVNI